MIELIGWLGNGALAICALPQVIECYKTKTANGVSGAFLSLWLFGEVVSFIYALPLMKYPLFFNYALNITFISVICYYKLTGAKQ